MVLPLEAKEQTPSSVSGVLISPSSISGFPHLPAAFFRTIKRLLFGKPVMGSALTEAFLSVERVEVKTSSSAAAFTNTGLKVEALRTLN